MGVWDLFQLKGKVALVTGAGSGLGRVFCEAMAEAGGEVVCADINESWAKETEEIIARYGVKTLVIKADVSRQEDVKAMFSKVEKEFGKLDVLFNNAGVTTKSLQIHEMPLEDWNRVIGINLTGVFMCMQEGIKMMLRHKKGSIINIASVLGIVGVDPNLLALSNYAAAKSGVIGLTRQGAAEYGPFGIRINAIAPGWHLGTRLADGAGIIQTEEEAITFAKKISELTPMRRVGEPVELKGLAIYLASDASSFVTGSVFVQDGGWSAW